MHVGERFLRANIAFFAGALLTLVELNTAYAACPDGSAVTAGVEAIIYSHGGSGLELRITRRAASSNLWTFALNGTTLQEFHASEASVKDCGPRVGPSVVSERTPVVVRRDLAVLLHKLSEELDKLGGAGPAFGAQVLALPGGKHALAIQFPRKGLIGLIESDDVMVFRSVAVRTPIDPLTLERAVSFGPGIVLGLGGKSLVYSSPSDPGFIFENRQGPGLPTCFSVSGDSVLFNQRVLSLNSVGLRTEALSGPEAFSIVMSTLPLRMPEASDRLKAFLTGQRFSIHPGNLFDLRVRPCP
jgi:hypothetical protein